MLTGLGLKEQSLVMKEAAQVNPTERIVGEVAGVCVCYVGFVHHLVGPRHSLGRFSDRESQHSDLTVSSLSSET